MVSPSQLDDKILSLQLMLLQLPHLLKGLPEKLYKHQQLFTMYRKFSFFIIPTLVTSYLSIERVQVGPQHPIPFCFFLNNWVLLCLLCLL